MQVVGKKLLTVLNGVLVFFDDIPPVIIHTTGAKETQTLKIIFFNLIQIKAGFLIFLKDILLQKLQISIVNQTKPFFSFDSLFKLETWVDDVQKRERVILQYRFQLLFGIFFVGARCYKKSFVLCGANGLKRFYNGHEIRYLVRRDGCPYD